MKRLLLVAFLLVLLATPISAQETGVWTQHAGTAFAPWAQTSGLAARHNDCHASSGVDAIINAWSTMALHEARGELLSVRGGGHADSCLNGAYAFRFATKSWHILTTPSPREVKNAQGQITTPGYHPMTAEYPNVGDLPNPYSGDPRLPASVHVYGALATITTGSKAGQVMTAGGIYWSRGGESSPPHSWLYDPMKATADTAYTKIATRPGGYGTALIWNPVTHRMVIRASGVHALYNPDTDSYQTLFSQSVSGGGGSNPVISDDGTTMYTWDGGLKKVHFPTAATTKQQAVPVTGATVTPAYGMGLVYDAGRLFLLAKGTSAAGALYTVQVERCGGAGQPACNVVQLITPGVLPPPVPAANGTWGRFTKFGCDLWLVVDGVKDVYSFRPSTPLSTCGIAPPPTYMLTLTSAGSTGAGTLTGAGTYAPGAVATVIATPAAGSSAGAVTGDPGCALGPVTMNGNKTCNVPFLDIQPPAVAISSPADKQIVKAPVPVTYAVTENMPPATVTVLLDGQAFTGPALDPATLTEGFHQLVVQAVDAAGNSSAAVANFVSVKCPVCPVAKATLTTLSVGTGHGTITGAGTYGVGDPVAVVPTPNVDSTLEGMGPAPCSATVFLMPATNLECLVTFTLKPPPMRTLSAVSAGTGSGTVTGMGAYAVGSQVALTPSPAVGSTYTGMAPAPCSNQPFPMPATDLACTVTFNAVPPSTGGPAVGLPARTWKPMPMGIMSNGQKHARLAHDTKRKLMVLAGGDGTDGSGNSFTGQNVFTVDLAASVTWTRAHGNCPPPGGVMPARPDDVTWAYDPKRDNFVVMPAYFGGGTANCPGYVDDTIKRPYTFSLETNRWTLSAIPTPAAGGWGGDIHNHWGVLDPVTDAVYRFHYGCGAQMVPLDGSPATCYALSFAGAPAGSWDMSNDQSVIDVQGRALYNLNRYKRVIVKWSITQKQVVDVIPLPATWVAPSGEFGGSEYETYLAFDSRNRVLFLPNTVGYTGTLINTTTGLNRGIYFLNVETKVWESEPAPADNSVSGNVLGYDEANNVFLFLGRSASKRMWLYRYK